MRTANWLLVNPLLENLCTSPLTYCLVSLDAFPILSTMRLLNRTVLTALGVVLTFILVLSLTCIGASPALAQTVSQQSQNSASYIPKYPNVKDEQNINFLYDLYEANKGQPDFLDALPDDVVTRILSSREAFANFYYSPDQDAFTLRESMKLLRAMSCKVSRLTGVRGIDLVSKGVNIIDGLLEPSESGVIRDYGMAVDIWKSAYEHFCPNLW